MKKMAAEVKSGGCFLTAKVLILSAAILIAGTFFGCQTVPKKTPVEEKKDDGEYVYVPIELEEVNPLALIGDDFSIYTYIPANKHRGLTAALLLEEIDTLDDSDAKLIAKRIEELYLGLGTVEDRSKLEAAALGNIPTVGVKAAFSKRYGWNQEKYKAVSNEKALRLKYPNEFTYYSNEDTAYDMCFFSQQVFGIAQNLTPIMEKYAVRPEVSDTPYNKWISQESDDILFYITRPGQYLTSLIGSSITINTDYIYGSLKHIEDEIYYMTMNIHIANKKAIPALKSLLGLSFGMMGASLSQPDEETLQLSDIEVTQKQIVNLFTRDPVTGKHYKVVDDKVIEEAM